MRKLLLSLFAALLIYGSVQSVMAAEKYLTYYDSYQGRTYRVWYYDSPYNTGPSIDPSYTVIQKNSAYTTSTSSRIYVDAFKIQYATGDNPNYPWNINNATSVTRPYSLSSNKSLTFYNVDFPVFNNRNDSVSYSTGGSFNSANIIAGSVPSSYYFSNDTTYQPKITNSTYAYLNRLGGNDVIFNPILSFVPLWVNVSSDFVMQLHASFDQLPQLPTYQKSSIFVFVDMPSVSDVQSFVSEYGFNIDSPLFLSQVNAFCEQHNSFRWINSMNYTSKKVSGEFTRDTLDITFNSIQRDSAGFSALVTEYGSETAAYIAYYLLGRINSISVVDYGYNSSLNQYVAYPAGQFYYDKNFYDGTLYQKRQISVSVPPSSGNNAPTYNEPGNPSGYTSTGTVLDNEIQKNYTDLINQNNGNTTINNYYQGLDQRIDQFEDGTLNIDDTISNVVSVAKSVSHIGLIFGYLFNGFLPAEMITLLGFAFVLIPIVVIIKLIRG